MVSPFISLWC